MGEIRDPLATGKILWVQPWLLGKCVMPKGLGLVPAGEAAAWAAVTTLSCHTRPPELQATGQHWRPGAGMEVCHTASDHRLFPRTGPLLGLLVSRA